MKLSESRVIGPKGLMYRAIPISEIMPAGIFLDIPNEEIMTIHRSRPEMFIGCRSDDWLLIPARGGTACVIGAAALKMFKEEAGLTIVDLEQADFSDALMWLKEGKRVARRGWNGKGQFIVLIPGSNLDRSAAFGLVEQVESLAFVDVLALKNADGYLVCGWTPSTGDLLADDWIALP